MSVLDRLAAWSDRRWMLVLFVLALGARLAIVAALGAPEVDGYENEEIALNVLNGRGYSFAFFGPTVPTAHQYPLYTGFLLLHWWLAGGEWWLPVHVSQSVIGALAAPLLFVIGRDLVGRTVGLVAGTLLALYPVHAYSSTRGQSLVIEVTLLLALVALGWRLRERPALKGWVLAGLLLGACILAKTLYIVFLPAFAAWLWMNTRPPRAWMAPRVALAGVVALAVVLPWSVRNAVVLGKFFLVTSNGGYNLWVGNNPNASGSIFARDGVHVNETVPASMRVRLAALDDAGKDALFRQEAREWIRENPGRFVRLIPARLKCLWWFDSNMPTSYGGPRELIYVGLLAAGLLGWWVLREHWRSMSIWPLLALLTSALYSVYYGGARFRYLLEPGLLVLPAAALVVAVARRLLRRP